LTPDVTNPASTAISDQDHEISREDLTQTEGAPLPDVAPAPLTGDPPARLWARLARVVTADGYRVERGPCGGAYGHTRFTEKVVRVRAHVEEAQAAKTLAHDLLTAPTEMP